MPVVIAIIAAVAGLIVYLWSGPSCDGGGAIVASEAECAAKLGAPFCARAWAQAERDAARAAPVFLTESECVERHRTCFARTDVNGYSPKPTSYCIQPSPTAGAPKTTPYYSSR